MNTSRTARVANIVGVVGVISVLFFGGFLAISNTHLQQQLELSQDYGQKLSQQLISEGISPTATPPKAVTGSTGPTGDRGPGPTDSQVYAAVKDYCQSGNVPCKGDLGATGAPGAAVIGPEGPAGESVVGPAGAPGANGKDGASGVSGQPPYSWRYTTAAGVPVLCSRDTPFDPAQPTYTCAPVAPIP